MKKTRVKFSAMLLAVMLIITSLSFAVPLQAGAETYATSTAGKFTADQYVRSGPSTSYTSLDVMSAGTYINIISRDSATGWYRVEYAKNQYGYTSNLYLSVISSQIGTLTSDQYIRSGPSTSYSTLGTLTNGSYVLIIGTESNGWYKIIYDGTKVGYTSYAYVSIGGNTSSSKVQAAINRAEQMVNYRWSPKANVTGWRGNYTFSKGGSYTIPYSQPYSGSGKYLFYGISLDSFNSAVASSSNAIYSNTYKNGDSVQCPIYGMDCSSFVSYILGLSSRATTSTFNTYATNGSNGFSFSNYTNIKAGDIINKAASHVRFVYKVSGDTVYYYEQTPNNGLDTRKSSASKTTLQNAGYKVISYAY